MDCLKKQREEREIFIRNVQQAMPGRHLKTVAYKEKVMQSVFAHNDDNKMYRNIGKIHKCSNNVHKLNQKVHKRTL